MMPGQNCTACKKPIYGAPKKLGNTSYHDACFVCSQCKVKLQITTHKQYKGALLCSHCYANNLRSVQDSGGLVGGLAAPPPVSAKNDTTTQSEGYGKE